MAIDCHFTSNDCHAADERSDRSISRIHKMSGVKRSRTSLRIGMGSSSQEQQEPELSVETPIDFLRMRLVARKHLLSDFDDMMYEDNTLFRLFEYQGFLHQLSWTVGFCVDDMISLLPDAIAAFMGCERPKTPCFPAVPLTDKERKSEAAAAPDTIAQLLNNTRASRSEAPINMEASAAPPPWVAQLFADLETRVNTIFKNALKPLKELVDKLDWDIQTRFEEIRNTLDEFKTEADPHKILRPVPTAMTNFGDDV
ncbi:hypothetical protein CJ030_MR5G016142 [Morella rubra]|uniref:Uncharacterized protein n=1 Tax=Morella rubra TaxID=262757 RepID=A0A6A1VJC5_9ROSI|nr:hypothetical protein CJ030_MR5G016142 [Morella rubra]